MPRCPDIYTLQAFADRQLVEAQERALAEHLATCRECAEAVSELRRACLPLHLLHEDPPAELLGRLLGAVADVTPLPSLSCEKALEWVSLRLDGELTHERAQRLEAHLYACAGCYRAAQEIETASGLLRETEPAAAPAGLLERVQAAAALAAPSRPAPQTAWRRWGLSLAGVAAAAAVFLAVFLNVLTPATDAPLVAVTPRAAAVAPAAEPAAPVTPPAVGDVQPESPSTALASSPTHEAAGRPTGSPSGPAASTSAGHRAVATRPPDLPAAPAAVLIGHDQPVTVAVAPDAVAVLPSGRPCPCPHPPRPEVTLAALPPVAAPAPARTATVDGTKPAPALALAAAPPPAPARTHSNWVSRPTSAEREVYRSEDASPRLADAREALDRDITDIRQKGRTPSIKRWAIH